MNMLLASLMMAELEFIDIEPTPEKKINEAKYKAKYYLKYGSYSIQAKRRVMKLATKKDIRKWFPFLNSWKPSDEPKMLKEIHKRQREIIKARKMSKGLLKRKMIEDYGY